MIDFILKKSDIISFIVSNKTKILLIIEEILPKHLIII
jgi:hypothetical protein